jgi:hypothetical protein
MDDVGLLEASGNVSTLAVAVSSSDCATGSEKQPPSLNGDHGREAAELNANVGPIANWPLWALETPKQTFASDSVVATIDP